MKQLRPARFRIINQLSASTDSSLLWLHAFMYDLFRLVHVVFPVFIRLVHVLFVHMDICDGTIFLNLQVSGVEYAVATHAMLSCVYHVFVNRNVKRKNGACSKRQASCRKNDTLSPSPMMENKASHTWWTTWGFLRRCSGRKFTWALGAQRSLG